MVAQPIHAPDFNFKLTDSKKASEFIFAHVDLEKIRLREHFYVLGLNRASIVNTFQLIGIGSEAAVVADLKAIIRHVLISFSSGLLICHNHPSGNLRPSEQDNRLTKQVKEACKIMDITFIDHIIIGENCHTGEKGFYSFADEGLT